MLCAIDTSTERSALDILSRGFTNRPREFWKACLARIHRAGGNTKAGVPAGYLLMSGKDPIGVALTPAGMRPGTTGSQERMINMSSWYIEPEHRWRGPMMLRSIIRTTDATFTDLTPTASVQKILLALGFKPINAGESVVLLPQASLRPAHGARVIELERTPKNAIADETRHRLARHTEFGCIALALDVEGLWLPLLFKPCARRGIPGLRLIYCEDHILLRRAISPVARALLRRGKLFLIRDLEAGEKPGFGIARPGFALKYATRSQFSNRTDYTGTELCLFDL